MRMRTFNKTCFEQQFQKQIRRLVFARKKLKNSNSSLGFWFEKLTLFSPTIKKHAQNTDL